MVPTTASSRAWPSSVAGSATKTQVEAAAPRPTRPRSWCSCASPKRSAPKMTIKLALGTSTPTSITVVATSTRSVPSRKAAMVSSRVARSRRPCTTPKGTSAKGPCWRRGTSSSKLGSPRSPGSIAGTTIYACSPSRTSSPTRANAASILLACMATVRMGFRPGGSSSKMETSRSP